MDCPRGGASFAMSRHDGVTGPSQTAQHVADVPIAAERRAWRSAGRPVTQPAAAIDRRRAAGVSVLRRRIADTIRSAAWPSP